MALHIEPRDPWAELEAAEVMLAILVDRLGGRAEFTLEELETPKADGWEIGRFESLLSLAVVLEVRKPRPVPVPEDDEIVDAEVVGEWPDHVELAFHHEPHPELPGVVIPVLDCPVQMDPATGAVEWDL